MRKHHISLVLMILLPLFIYGGCEEEDFESLVDESALTSSGEDDILSGVSSDYTTLLDISSWTEILDPDNLPPELMQGDWDDFAEAIIDGLGFLKWEQTKLTAEESGSRVKIESVMKFTGGEDDDSLCGLLHKWTPGNSKTPSYIQRDKLLGMLSIGNPTGFLDAKLEWLTKSDSFRNILDSIPSGEAKFPLIMGWNTIKMTIKGYWYTAKYEYYSMIGDSCTIAFYENDEFNWEDGWYADTYLEGTPFRFLIALDLDEPGFVDWLNQTAENNIDLLDRIFYPYRRYAEVDRYPPRYAQEYKETEKLELKTKQISGNEIHYIDFGGVMQLAWMEYGGALLVSDLDTIENIDTYFNPSNPVEGIPEKFNDYIYVDVQKCSDNFYYPFEDSINEEIDYWEEYADGPAIETAKQVVRNLRMSRLGVMELTEVFDGTAATTTLELNKDAADLMLTGIYFLEIMLEEGLDALSYDDRVFKGPDPTRYPELPQLAPVEPPARIEPGDPGQGRS